MIKTEELIKKIESEDWNTKLEASDELASIDSNKGIRFLLEK